MENETDVHTVSGVITPESLHVTIRSVDSYLATKEPAIKKAAIVNSKLFDERNIQRNYSIDVEYTIWQPSRFIKATNNTIAS